MLKTYILTIISVTLWGLSFVWTNDILNHNVPPFTFLFIRLATAGALLFMFAKLTKRLQKVSLKDYGYMLLMAFFEPFIYFIGETHGMLATGSAVIAAVIIASIPIFCIIAERFLYKIPFTAFKIIGTLVTIPGIIMVVIKNNDNASVDHYYGIALLFLAVFAATGYGAVVKKLSGKYTPVTITTYQFVFGSLFFFPLFLAYGLDGLNATFFSAEVLKPLIALAVLCSCVAFLFWVTAIRNLGIAKANIFSALIPAVSAVGAAMMGQESITVLAVAGIAIVIAGVIIAQRSA